MLAYLNRKVVGGWIHVLSWCGVAVLVMAVSACNENAKYEPVKTQPSELPPPALPTPTTRETPKPQPETQPTASGPVKPESTFRNVPPFPVSLYVETPEEKQPGWLRIEKLAEDGRLATAQGRFPEQNRIYVDTSNVRRVRIHVSELPLAPNERLILQIDKQGMVLSRKHPYVILNRQLTGEWVVEKLK